MKTGPDRGKKTRAARPPAGSGRKPARRPGDTPARGCEQEGNAPGRPPGRIRESEEEYRAFYENSMDGILLTAPDGRIFSANPAACEILRMTEEEICGRGRAGLLDTTDPGIQAAIRRRAETGKFSGELVLIRGDGTRFVAEVTSSIFRDREGRDRANVIFRDITWRKQAEASLREREFDLAEAQRVAKIGSWKYDIATAKVSWSGELYRIFEVDSKDFFVTYDSFLSRIHPDDRLKASLASREAREIGKPFEVEYRILTRSGRVKYIREIGYAMRGPDNGVVGLFGTAQDITEQKQAEEALRNYGARLIETEEEMRKKLAAELHDEIGRDLTAAGINLAIISDQLSAESRTQLGARVADTVRLVEEMSRNIRSIMAELRPPVLDDYGLAAAVRWYAGFFTDRTGIEVILRIDEGFPRLSNSKELALFRIVQEALTNASKHAGTKYVTIIMRSEDGRLYISVADSGKGFDPGVVMSYRDGTGRGLAIMRERCESIGCLFTIESARGKGTVITIEVREAG